MRPRHLDVWRPGLVQDFGLFARDMGLFSREMTRVGRDFGRMQRRAQTRRAAHWHRRNPCGAGAWAPSRLGPPGLYGLVNCGAWTRRRAIRYRSHYRARRFWRTLQILLGVALVAIVIAIMSRQGDGSPHSSNWL